MYQYVRKYPFSLVCFVIIWVLSLTPIFPETPFDNVQFADKWTHLVMYGGTCGVLWIEYLRSHTIYNKVKLFLWAWVAPIVMSGVLELLQEYCTGGRRDGDWLDLLANATGVTLAALFGMVLMKAWRK
jgi:VanZ family protein